MEEQEEHRLQMQVKGLTRSAWKGGITLAELVRQIKRQLITDVLREHRFNQCHAAKALQMHRNTLSRTLGELHIDLAALRAPAKKQVRGERPYAAAAETA